MYERFTDRARKVMQLANTQAKKYNQLSIDTEHILLGLVEEGSGIAANVLKNLDVDLRKVQMLVERDLQRGNGEAATGRLPHTPKVLKVIDAAVKEARGLNHNYVGTEHLLLGLLGSEEGLAAQVLTNLGLKIANVREEVLNLLGHNLPDHKILEALQPNSAGIYPVFDLDPTDKPNPSDSLPPQSGPFLRLFDEEIERLNREKRTALMEPDFEKAAALRDQVVKLQRRRAEIFSKLPASREEMNARFSDRARKVIQLASQEAQRFNHEYIGTEHILLGLAKEGAGVAATVLKNLNIDLGRIRGQIEKIVQHGPGGEQVVMGRLPHTPRARKAIDFSVEEARDLNHNYVGTEHLLLGLLREQEGVAAQVLMNLGLKLEDVREEVLKLLRLSTEASGSERSSPSSDQTSRAEETTYSSARTAAESLTVYQIELINERIRLLNQQMKESVAAQDLVQAGQFRSEAEALSKLLVLYFWSRSHS